MCTHIHVYIIMYNIHIYDSHNQSLSQTRSWAPASPCNSFTSAACDMREHCVQSFKLSRSRVPRFCGASRTSSRISPYGGFHQQTWEVNMIQPWKLDTTGDLSIKYIQICQTWCSMDWLKGTSTGHPWLLPLDMISYRFPLNSGKFRSTEYLEGEGIDVATAPYTIITISESIVHNYWWRLGV